MPSFWPWKGEAKDAAAFEKTLSTIAAKILKTGALNDSLRQRSRRFKTIITLWGGFAYILIAVISVLVTGWKNWGPVEWSIISGGPVFLYGARRACSVYYDYRISNTQAYLESLQKERDATIEKLKAATKYNSTQALLEKYGSSPQSAKSSPSAETKRKSVGGKQQETPQQGRTNIPPPPTANIPRNQGQLPGQAQHPLHPPSAPSTPVRPDQQLSRVQGGAPPGPSAERLLPGEEFASNAFATAPQYAPAPASRPGFFDRLMDALMGEDETMTRNRFALICQHCRLVNGQAPPGTVSLEDVGRWRCSACGGWNGQESEAKKLLEQISTQAKQETETEPTGREYEDDEAVVVEKSDGEDTEMTGTEDKVASDENMPAKSTRSKKGKGKK